MRGAMYRSHIPPRPACSAGYFGRWCRTGRRTAARFRLKLFRFVPCTAAEFPRPSCSCLLSFGLKYFTLIDRVFSPPAGSFQSLSIRAPRRAPLRFCRADPDGQPSPLRRARRKSPISAGPLLPGAGPAPQWVLRFPLWGRFAGRGILRALFVAVDLALGGLFLFSAGGGLPFILAAVFLGLQLHLRCRSSRRH